MPPAAKKTPSKQTPAKNNLSSNIIKQEIWEEEPQEEDETPAQINNATLIQNGNTTTPPKAVETPAPKDVVPPVKKRGRPRKLFVDTDPMDDSQEPPNHLRTDVEPQRRKRSRTVDNADDERPYKKRSRTSNPAKPSTTPSHPSQSSMLSDPHRCCHESPQASEGNALHQSCQPEGPRCYQPPFGSMSPAPQVLHYYPPYFVPQYQQQLAYFQPSFYPPALPSLQTVESFNHPPVTPTKNVTPTKGLLNNAKNYCGIM